LPIINTKPTTITAAQYSIKPFLNNNSRCACPPNWTGIECTVSLNPCLPANPCFNNALCSPSANNTFQCSCLPGFTGSRCETQVTPCLSQPCKNGAACTSLNQTSYACSCFSPYYGPQCESKLSLCDFISCGQGVCKTSADGFNATCLCNPGFIGQFCNLRPSSCASSPCRNGATCTDIATTGGYQCACTAEYEGTNCQTAKTCVTTFNYCASQPCLNGATCTPLFATCSFTCQCNSATSYGQFCQFSIAPVLYTAQQSLSVLTDQSVDFNIELRPCLVKAWQRANPQLACPPAYETIPGIDGCFSLTQATTANFTKASAEYACSLTGGSLLSLETSQKLTAVATWLNSTKKACIFLVFK
jgi:hypothetical protein